MKLLFLLPIVFLFSLSCVSQECHPRRFATDTQSARYVWVFLSSIESECPSAKELTYTEIVSLLGEIKVISKRMVRSPFEDSSCEIPKITFDTYLINKSDLDKANKLGFVEWKGSVIENGSQ